jgi:hypothetical protein
MSSGVSLVRGGNTGRGGEGGGASRYGQENRLALKGGRTDSDAMTVISAKLQQELQPVQQSGGDAQAGGCSGRLCAVATRPGAARERALCETGARPAANNAVTIRLQCLGRSSHERGMALPHVHSLLGGAREGASKRGPPFLEQRLRGGCGRLPIVRNDVSVEFRPLVLTSHWF